MFVRIFCFVFILFTLIALTDLRLDAPPARRVQQLLFLRQVEIKSFVVVVLRSTAFRL